MLEREEEVGLLDSLIVRMSSWSRENGCVGFGIFGYWLVPFSSRLFQLFVHALRGKGDGELCVRPLSVDGWVDRW
jgi:hypothetical protein